MRKGERLERMINKSVYRNTNQLSKATGVPYTTIKSFIERDLEKASIDSVVKIAKALNVSVEKLIGEDNLTTKSLTNNYPLYPVEISAGLPSDVEGITDAETIILPDALMGKYAGSKDIYITRVNGESMNEVIPHNSLIAVRPVSQESLKTGDILVYRKDSEYAVKRLVIDGDKFIFKPESTDDRFYDDVVTDDQEIAVKGKVVMSVIMYD